MSVLNYSPAAVYTEWFHDANEPWQEPWVVVDASATGYLELWYPDRGIHAHCTVHLPHDVYEQYAYENYSDEIRRASTMPFWARAE